MKNKNIKIPIIVILSVVGVILLIAGSAVDKKEKATKNTENKMNDESELFEYREFLQEEIKELCERVSGVSDVTVAVTLESGFEYVYATEINDEYSQGKSELHRKYLTIGNGSNENTVYITEKLPVIGGIGIVCHGGNDPNKVKILTDLVSAAYNIGSNKIFVTGT